MRCAIMQPTYLPWAGYFSLIGTVDYFYYLDCVQYSHHDWNNRNRILLSGQSHWLTIPIRRHTLDQKMTVTFIDEKQHGKWQRKHAGSLHHAYSKTPYYSHIEEIVDLIEKSNHRLLIDLNISVIEKVSQMLDIRTKTVRSSDVPVENLPRSDKLIALCRHVNCTHYVSPPGARQYLQEDNFSSLSDIALLFHHFCPIPYEQHSSQNFVSHLSIVDVIANLGIAGTKEYLGSYSLLSEQEVQS